MTTDAMAKQLEGSVAVVTGGGRGIGRGIALVLASRGASVVVSDIDGDAASTVAGELRASGAKAIGLAGDVTDAGSMQDLASASLAEFGKVDIYVPNAGVIGATGYAERHDYNDDDWRVTYDVNVLGMVRAAEAIIPHMKERRHGKIVNIASHGGRAPRGAAVTGLGTVQMPYAVSKAAAIQWTHVLAIELGRFDINVNVVCPGTLWTPMWEKIALNRKAHDPAMAGLSAREIFDLAVKSRMPLGKEQTPEDVGRAVAFLASDDAAQITGQALNVNGGAVMS